jgi:hypothetical protein
MSEINCFGNEVVYSEVIPNWSLVQLVNIINREFTVNEFVMGEGDFGLTQCNDPDFVFSMPPMLKPSKSEYFDTPEKKLYYKTRQHYYERLYGSVDTAYKLVSDCVKAGYNPTEDGILADWLLPKMYESLQKGKLYCYS